MQIVIDISEEDYERLKVYKKAPFCSLPSRVYEAVANGRPLPDNHGRLIDADALEYIEVCESEVFEAIPKMDIDDAPTIIPATKPPHWIERRLQMGLHDWICSVCKGHSEDTVRFCPHCGVDTEGRYEMEEDDGGYWFRQREEQTATKESEGV